MSRNAITSVLALALAASLAACGGGEQAGTAEMEEEGAAQAQAAQEAGGEMAGQEGGEMAGQEGGEMAGQEQEMDLPEGVTPEMVEEGKQIFTGAGICYTCHGQDAKGTALAPDLTDDEWLNVDGSYEQIVENVMTGVPEPKEHPSPMLPKGGSNITDEQVKAVAAYVWTLSRGG